LDPDVTYNGEKKNCVKYGLDLVPDLDPESEPEPEKKLSKTEPEPEFFKVGTGTAINN
jgi:hypothetical protein